MTNARKNPTHVLTVEKTQELLDALGGYAQLAKALGLSLSTVHTWKRLGMPKPWAYFLVTFFKDCKHLPPLETPPGLCVLRAVLMADPAKAQKKKGA